MNRDAGAIPSRFAISSAVIGRVDVGAGTVRVTEDDITIEIPLQPNGGAIRVPFASVDRVVGGGNADTPLALALRDGTSLLLTSADAAALRDAVLAECHRVPELTRALRGLGSRRTGRGERPGGVEDEVRFFAPLLAARRAAAAARVPGVALAAFDATALEATLRTTLAALASARAGNRAARRRSIEAELLELAEPLSRALRALDGVAAEARDDVDDLTRWRAWIAQLRLVMEAADRTWLSIDIVLAREPVARGGRA